MESAQCQGYVGYLGWVGVRLDRDLGWEEIAGVIEDAYLAVAPKKQILAARLHREPTHR